MIIAKVFPTRYWIRKLLFFYDNYRKKHDIRKENFSFSYDNYKIIFFKIIADTDIPSLSLHCGVS